MISLWRNDSAVDEVSLNPMVATGPISRINLRKYERNWQPNAKHSDP
jgi:hypothetical protein